MDEITSSLELGVLAAAAELVSAYVANNSLPAAELPGLILSVHAALAGLTSAMPVATQAIANLMPGQIRRSITPDALISFEDGRPYKTLRRHLTIRGLTAEAYRAKWGLPADYPMTSAAYSAQRSELARSLRLGHKDRPSSLEASEVSEDVPVQDAAAPAKRRGRPPNASRATADT